jgi:hypothetical protein
MSIESFIVRIIPGNTKHEEYSKRTSFYYKITGLPLNTSVQDMIPIVQHLAGKTCSFNDQGRYSTTKSAFVHTEEKNFKPKKQKTIFHKYTIYILPQYMDSTCVNCGSPNHHRIIDCTDEDFIQNGPHKIFKKRFIPRNNPTIITDQNINEEYKHVIQMNRSIKLQQQHMQDQLINQRNRGRATLRENTAKDLRSQRYRSKPKGEQQNTNNYKQKQKETTNNNLDNTDNQDIQNYEPENSVKQDTPINWEVKEFMTRSNKMFEVMNNKIQALEKSLEDQKNINEKLIKSINNTEEKHNNLELAMEKMMAQIAQLNGKMNVLIDAFKNNNNNNHYNEETHTNNNNTSTHDSNNTINNYQNQINSFLHPHNDHQPIITQTNLQYESVTSHDGMSQMTCDETENNEYKEHTENNNINNQPLISGRNWLNLTRYYTN